MNDQNISQRECNQNEAKPSSHEGSPLPPLYASNVAKPQKTGKGGICMYGPFKTASNNTAEMPEDEPEDVRFLEWIATDSLQKVLGGD